MATVTLKPAALSTDVTPASPYTTSTGTLTDSWQLIDDITSDSDYITYDDTQGSNQWILYDIGSLPADFVGADSGTTYTFRVRTYVTGYTNDTITLTCYLVGPNHTITQGSGTTGDSWAGSNGFNWTPRLSNATFPSTLTTATYSGSILTAGENASTADWSNAKLAINWSKNNQMGGDATQLFITAIEIDIIDYVQSIATLTLPTTTGITINSATVGCTTNIASLGTLYYYVSTSATPPSAADLKAGTGATDSGSTTSMVAGPNTFSATGLAGATNYYTHFIHNTPAGDSNILTSTQWTTLDPNRTVTCSTEQLVLTAPDATVEITSPIDLDFTGAVAGDELIAVLKAYFSSYLPTAFNAPAGWTVRANPFTGSSTNIQVTVFTKTATGSEGLETFGCLGDYTPTGDAIIIPGSLLESAVLDVEQTAPGISARIGFISAQTQPVTRPAYVVKGLTTVRGSEYDANGLVWHLDDGWKDTFVDETDGVSLNAASTRWVYTFVGSLETLDNRPVFVLESTSGQTIEDHTAASGSTPADYRWTAGRYAGSARTYNYHWNGTSWTSDTALSDSRYNHASSGTAAASLIAGGSNSTNSTSVETWNDVSWTTETSLNTARTGRPQAQGTQNDTLVECGTQATFDTEEWNGTAWSTGGTVSVDSLSHYAAGGASAAIKSGGYTTNTTTATYVTESYNGTSWASEANAPYGGYGGAGAGSTTDFYTIAGRAICGDEFATKYQELAHFVYSYNGTSWAVENRHPQKEHDALSAAGSSGTSMATHGGGGRSTYDEYYVAQAAGTGSLGIEPRMEASTTANYASWEIAYEATTNTVIIPPPATLNITTEIPDFRARKYKEHKRGIKPKWDRVNVQGLSPNFLNSVDSPIIGRTVNCITAELAITGNTATLTKTLTVSGVTEQLVLANNGSTVDRGRLVTCTTEALVVTSNTAAIQTDRDVAAITETLVITGNAATVQTDKTVAATTEQLTLTSSGATVGRGRTITSTTEALAVTTSTATIATSRTVSATTEALVVTSNTATIRKDRAVETATEQLVITTNAATVETGRVVTGTTEALLVSAQQALIQTDRDVAATTEQLSIGAQQALIALDRSVAGVTEALELAATTATIDFVVDFQVNCTTEELTLTTTAANVNASRDVTSTTTALLLTGNTGAIQTDRDIIGATEELLLTSTDSAIDYSRIVTSATEALELTPNSAQISTSRLVTAGTAALLLTENPANVDVARDVTASTATLQLSSTSAQISTSREVTTQTAALALTASTAGVQTDRVVDAATETLILDANISQIGRGTDRDVNASSPALELTATLATIARGSNVTGTTAALLLTASTATVVRGVSRTVTCSPEALELSTTVAAVQTDRDVATATETLELTANLATVDLGADRDVICATEALELTANPATVVRGASREVTCTTAALALTATQSSVGLGLTVSGGTAGLLLTATPANISTSDDRDVNSSTAQLALTAPAATVGRGLTVTSITEALLLTPTRASIIREGEAIEAQTAELILETTTAFVSKRTNVGSLPDYRDIGVIVQAEGADVYVLPQTG